MDQLKQYIEQQLKLGGPQVFDDVVATVKRQLLVAALKLSVGSSTIG
jgi:hypothetical protein